MPLAFDNFSPDTTGVSTSTLTSASWTIAGSLRALFAFAASDSGPPQDPTGIKWGGSGGVALTQIGTILSIGSFAKLTAWKLVAPTAASQTLFAQYGGTADEVSLGGVSYTGVDQTTPNDTSVTNTGTIASTSGTASATVSTSVGDLVLAGLTLSDSNFQSPTSTPTGSPLPTERYQVVQADGSGLLAIEELVATGASTTVSFAISSISTMDAQWGVIAFVVKADAGAASPVLEGPFARSNLNPMIARAPAGHEQGPFAYDRRRKIFLPKRLAA